MINDIQIFENEEFGKIRVTDIDGQPWFVGKDIAARLGYANASEALKYHVDEEDKLNSKMLSSLGQRGGWLINESGLYSLILSSKLPNAKTFKRWVTSEVLPSIRKHGAYITEELLCRIKEDGDYINDLIGRLKAEKAKTGALIGYVEEAAPKALYCDTILLSPDAVQVSIIAKDYGMSAAAFNKLLHRMGVQFRIGKTWLLYQQHQGNGYTVTNTYTRNGMVTYVHTCFTQRGRFWLYNLLKSCGILPEVERMAQMALDDYGMEAGSRA